MSLTKLKGLLATLFIFILAIGLLRPEQPGSVLAQEESTEQTVFLPLIAHDDTPTPTNTPMPTDTPVATATDEPAPTSAQRRVNAPSFAGDVIFEQMAIFWFGVLSETSNYADVRVGYNQSGLTIYVAAFDRHLWYDESPDIDTLTDWDAVTLLLDTDADGTSLTDSAYRFVAQLSGDTSPAHRASYRGSVQGWQLQSVPFDTLPGWRGESLNNNSGTDRGWVMTFTIPFASLGLSAPPATGSEWKLALQLHDRDGAAEAPQPVQVWPPAVLRDEPATWGRLRFGLPAYAAPAVAPAGETVIRRPTQNDPAVPDADVGSAISNQCPGDDFHIWNEWANRNYGSAPDFNIQNQADIADWPCFAKYYVTFPLDAVPADKVIISATLTLHQFGNAGDASQAQPSWIQVLTAEEDWQETTIAWNNAPLAWENVTGRWVDPVTSQPAWPGVPRTWDVTYAVAAAYQDGVPARLILYEADSAYHSGKYFVSSDTGDWNVEGRPALRIVWGDAPINTPTNTPSPPTIPPPTDTPILTDTPTPSATAAVTSSPTATYSPTASTTPTPSATAAVTSSPTTAQSATATQSPTASTTPTPSATAAVTSSPTATATTTATATATSEPAPTSAQRRVNAPSFAGDVLFEQMAIFWFGQLSETSNYADVRVGYNQTGLTVYVATFDRHLWSSNTPTPATLTDWDAVTLLLDTNASTATLLPSAYRFVAQLSNDADARYRTAYQGNAGNWQGASPVFTTTPGWRGTALNNNADTDRGWAMTFSIPFSSLGLAGAPASGVEWKLAIQLHDRDASNEASQPIQFWPETLQRDNPTTWGRLRFGLPGYTPPTAASPEQSTIFRQRQSDATVPDADVGSTITNQCPGNDFHIWNEWANRNYGSAPDFNIQNQSDIADWPCFAKYYVTFPLDAVPAGKVIISATLTLHQFGNSGDANQAQPSWIQVLTAAEAWQENTITWNNAPLAWENIGGSWVDPLLSQPSWPGVPRTWDVTYAAASAYANNDPLRLILYEADSAYHSGKYFVSSDTGDWNVAGRPTLRIVWGNPSTSPTNTPTVTPVIPATNTPVPPTATQTPTATPVAANTPTATNTATATPVAANTPTATTTTTATPNPLTPSPTAAISEWTQHAHDAQRTSYTVASVPTPWRWKWAWNGPTSTGGVSAGKFGLPRNSQPVTGGGRVYIAAGSNGVYALDNANGAVLWNRSPGGNINSTPAYDGDTGALFVVSANGTLFKLDAATGATLDSFAGDGASTLPLPPAIAGDRVFFSMGNSVYAIDKRTMQQVWRYDAGSPVDTPPAYSATRDSVVVASRDLYVHAIRNSDGGRIWRSKTTPRTAGNPGGSSNDAEVSRGWPVIAEQNGLVLVKLRLDWQTLWRWSPWPSSNATMRSNLTSEPAQQALLALDLDDGAAAFVANVGHGGFGDGDYMPMGPQPVVKRFDDGSEVAYVVMRGSPCQAGYCDGRWDSHLGEMMLNDGTVSGFEAGDVRFIANTFFPTDEQANLSMAGDHLLGGHWMFGLAHQIVNRAANRGASADTPITTADLPHIITSASNCGFSTSHYCAGGLQQDGDARTIPAGFYIYYNQGAVYDRFWSEYASWVVSNDTVYYVSTDGAVVALENGQPTGIALNPPQEQAFTASLSFVHEGVIDYTAARSFAGRTVTVEGTLHDVFNNGKAVYLTFQTPHQGAFLAKIRKAAWTNFAQPPEQVYAAGQRVQVTGLIEWYQGDPVIYVTQPGQIRVLE